MNNMDKLFEKFDTSFKQKVKCTKCKKKCSNFCPDGCLGYTQNKIPDYGCNYLRNAYVLRYFPTHKAELQKLYEINTTQIFSHISLNKRQDQLVLLGLGAGPGTDLIAFCEWLNQHNSDIDKRLSVTFIRADANDDWKIQYDNLKNIFKSSFVSVKADFAFRKRIVDAFDATKWPKNTHVTSASYLISELISKNNISDCKQQISYFWDTFKEKTDARSIILINDRPEEDVRAISKHLANLVKTTYKKSQYKEYCFNKDCFQDATGITLNNDKWCGCHLPDNMQKKYKSKTVCNSYQGIIFVNKS